MRHTRHYVLHNAVDDLRAARLGLNRIAQIRAIERRGKYHRGDAQLKQSQQSNLTQLGA
jgi:hypothetical protein